MKYQHKPNCPVFEERSKVLSALVDKWEIEGTWDGALIGAAIEYYGGGDQEREACTCGFFFTDRYKDLWAEEAITFGDGDVQVNGKDSDGARVWILLHVSETFTIKTFEGGRT